MENNTARRIPTRMCVICRKRSPKSSLARFVTRGGSALADPRQNLPGRGSYCCSSPECRKRFEAGNARKCKGV
ncbi:MAG: YlxR family protein [Deltaproteobacteria bacterium]|nr:YlxR family protein [Deltaproteobacteria bacterium]